MKKILAITTALLVTAGLNANAFAAEEQPSLTDKAGITPSSILYPVDVAIDNLKINLAVGDKSKVNIIIKVAEERLGECQVMMEKGKEEAAKKLALEYQDKMNTACGKLENNVEEIKDASKVQEEDKKSEEVNEIQEKVQTTQEKSIEVLNIIKDKASDNAKVAIDDVIKMQMAKKDAVKNMVQKRHEYNAAKKSLKAAEVEVKKAVKSGDEEAIKKAQASLDEKKAIEAKAKEDLIAAINAKKEAVKTNLKEKKDIKKVNKAESKIPSKGKEIKDKRDSNEGAKAQGTQKIQYREHDKKHSNGVQKNKEHSNGFEKANRDNKEKLNK